MVNRRQVLIAAMTAGGIVGAEAETSRQQRQPARLRAYLLEQMRAAKIPGMQVAIVQDGEIRFLENFGQADVENALAVKSNTRFAIASLTKAFVGVAVMQLVEGGLLDLDAPASRYLPDWPSAWAPVTVGQLATHMSGLPDIVADLGALKLVVDGDMQASWAKVQTMPMEFIPGEKFSYNQTNYLLLGQVIDRLGKEPFAQYLQRRQFDVVGMPDTVFGDDHDIVMRRAPTYTPYLLTGGTARHTDNLYNVYTEFPTMLRTCGGLNSSAGDLARWLIALDHGDLFRKSTTLATLRTARPFNNGEPGPWAIGGSVTENSGHPAFYAVGAAKAAFAIYPKDKLAVTVLTNLSADMGLPFVNSVAAFYRGERLAP